MALGLGTATALHARRTKHGLLSGDCMTDDYHTCEWCGATPLWENEMSKVPGKCLECFREECSHSDLIRDYQGSNHHRVRFTEHCIKCHAEREVRLFFHNRYPDRTEWIWYD